MQQLLFKASILWFLFLFRLRRFRTRAALVRWQQKGLRTHERFLRQHSPYFKRMLVEYGSIEQVPMMNKSVFMAHFSEINTVGIEREQAWSIAMQAEESRDFSSTIGPIAVGLSSGTSGNRGIFLVSPRERALWVAAVLDKVIGLSLRPRKVAFFLRSGNRLYDSVRSSVLQFVFYDLSRPFDALLKELVAQQPHIIVAQPAVLMEIAAYFEQSNSRWQIEKVISVAEVLETDVRDHLQTVFGIPISQVYQCTEGFLASSCSQGRLHFHEDFLWVEKKWLDDAHTRFHPVITDFTRRTQPVVRYELNDIIHVSPLPCPCGSVHTAIEMIEGRQDDMLAFIQQASGETVLVFPDFIRKIMLQADASHAISQYQVVQPTLNQIEIFLNTHQPDHAVIQQSILDCFGNFCASNHLDVPAIRFAGSVLFAPMQKFRRVQRLFAPEKSRYL